MANNSGDQLASGGRSAQFNQASTQSELENDLKIQTPLYVMNKYLIDSPKYKELVKYLTTGEPLPEGIGAAILEPQERIDGTPLEISAIADPVFDSEFAEVEEAKPEVGYAAEPFGDNILVTRVAKEHTSNLIIPDSMKAKSEIGYVVAVGEAVKNVKAGMLILFDRFASHGNDYKFIDEEGIERPYVLLREYDAMCKLKKFNVSDRTESA